MTILSNTPKRQLYNNYTVLVSSVKNLTFQKITKNSKCQFYTPFFEMSILYPRYSKPEPPNPKGVLKETYKSRPRDTESIQKHEGGLRPPPQRGRAPSAPAPLVVMFLYLSVSPGLDLYVSLSTPFGFGGSGLLYRG